MTEFEPGDRVQYTGTVTPELTGEYGTVVGVSPHEVRVRFDYGLSKYRHPHGYGISRNRLERVGKGWGVAETAPQDATADKPTGDVVETPAHYLNHPSGIECITITQHMNFCRGNAIKYVWRAGEKGGKDKEIEDLRKAARYIDIEIKRLEASK